MRQTNRIARIVTPREVVVQAGPKVLQVTPVVLHVSEADAADELSTGSISVEQGAAKAREAKIAPKAEL